METVRSSEKQTNLPKKTASQKMIKAETQKKTNRRARGDVMKRWQKEWAEGKESRLTFSIGGEDIQDGARKCWPYSPDIDHSKHILRDSTWKRPCDCGEWDNAVTHALYEWALLRKREAFRSHQGEKRPPCPLVMLKATGNEWRSGGLQRNG